jgi:uncharacterized membrane protein
MSRKRKISLYLMSAFYTGAGLFHFIYPPFYLAITPRFLPYPEAGNYAGGITEIALALMLLSERTRRPAAFLIMTMLIVFFFVIHIPITIEFYRNHDPRALWSLLRCPLQVPLVWWAWVHAKRTPADTALRETSI